MPKAYDYKYPWDEMKWHFFHENKPGQKKVSLKDVSKRYNVPYQTARRYAAKDNWHGDRAWMWAFRDQPKTEEDRARRANEIVRESLR